MCVCSCVCTPACVCVYVCSLFRACLFAEGMLTLRAKPPTEADLVDSLQKLKLALNLLVRYHSNPSPPGSAVIGWARPLSLSLCVFPLQAKLKKHIQNPSASELVHFLFGPLELVR